MPIDKETLAQVTKALRPLVNRIANMISRGTVKLADDTKKLQLLQVGALAGETVDAAEFFQAYGFSSIPLEGAEVVVVFPNGDRSHPLVIGASDRRYRPTGGHPGEVTMYNDAGAKMTMTKDGDIIATPAPGRQVLIDDGSGGTDALVKRSEFLEHGHATAATGPVSPPMVAPSSTPSTVFPGTTLLQSK